MPIKIEFYWSFRSPYCYLAMARARALAAGREVTVEMRPVYPLAVRYPEVFVTAPPQRLTYPRLDRKRVADYLGLPFADPDPDPLLFGDDRRPLAEQPYIHRLTRLGAEAAASGGGLEFFDEVSKLIWSGAVKGWHRGDHLAGAAARAGLDLAEMDRRIAADPDAYDAILAGNYAGLQAAGHWGVPTFVIAREDGPGEPFFGQDRFDVLLWRLERMGIGARPAGIHTKG